MIYNSLYIHCIHPGRNLISHSVLIKMPSLSKRGLSADRGKRKARGQPRRFPIMKSAMVFFWISEVPS
ncbi:MAG: hypothetical protein OD815_000670 [Candidatus Alkanophagales archaeon MCA70_species_2]|nr:hypothetical protein [Candidatus Alkanophaga liquidiphilum]